jgi:hypothetical protein
VLAKAVRPPFEPFIYKSNFDPEYVRDHSVLKRLTFSQQSSVHSYAYTDSFDHPRQPRPHLKKKVQGDIKELFKDFYYNNEVKPQPSARHNKTKVYARTATLPNAKHNRSNERSQPLKIPLASTGIRRDLIVNVSPQRCEDTEADISIAQEHSCLVESPKMNQRSFPKFH